MKETQHSTLPEEAATQYVCILVWVVGWVCISFILLTHESNTSHTVTAILRELMNFMLLCNKTLFCTELETYGTEYYNYILNRPIKTKTYLNEFHLGLHKCRDSVRRND